MLDKDNAQECLRRGGRITGPFPVQAVRGAGLGGGIRNGDVNVARGQDQIGR